LTPQLLSYSTVLKIQQADWLNEQGCIKRIAVIVQVRRSLNVFIYEI